MADYLFQYVYQLRAKGRSGNYDSNRVSTTTTPKITDPLSVGSLNANETVGTPFGEGIFTGSTIGGSPVIRVGSDLYLFSDNPNLSGNIKPGDFTTEAKFSVLCLTQGSRIRLASGDSIDISELREGDLVQTIDGPRPVRFVGRSTYSLFQLQLSGKLPVRIEAHALGELGPSEPIHCTPNHAFAIRGCLVEARALLNGTTIRQLDSWEESTITYYSLELEEHALVWANDLLSETYVATERNGSVTRTSWSNYDDYLARFGASSPMKDMPMPRIPFARQLPPEIRRIAGLGQATATAPIALV